VQWLTREHPELNLAFSISATSRPPRGTEQHGIEYFFLAPEEFKQKINDNEFLEYEEVYTNRYYGTLKGQIEELLRNGKNVIFDIDIKGGLNIKKYFGERALAIFIQPPGVDELRKRLVGRATDSQEQIEERLGKAEYEMSFASQFDTIIINDDLDIAKSETLTTIQKFLKDSNTFWQQYSV
jgi:guanylate kinase